MTIKNLRWELEATFTRKQVIAMATLADAVVNIKDDLTKELPAMFKDFDWASVSEVMTLFCNLSSEDTLGAELLCKVVDDVNASPNAYKVQLLCGKAVPNSPFEVGDRDE